MAAKGYDDSPPRNGIIFFYTLLTVFILIGVKFLLDSYFASMMSAEYHEKVYSRGMAEVAAVRAQEEETLSKGQVPIDQAMRLIGQRGRSASPTIAPASGANAPEVAGWSQLKRGVAEPPKAEEEAPKAEEEAAPAAEGAEGAEAAPEGVDAPAPEAPAPEAPAPEAPAPDAPAPDAPPPGAAH